MDTMRTSRTPRPAVILPSALIAGVLALSLSGCAMRVTDTATETPVASESPTQNPATSTPDPGPTPASPDAFLVIPDPDAAQERADLIAAATTVLRCDGERTLDEQATVVRVEGECDVLVVAMDAGVVVADDVRELQVTGAGSVVYAGKVDVLTVSGTANSVTWTGATPDVRDTGVSNILRAG